MERNSKEGLILRHLRRRIGFSLQKAAALIGKSSGWLSEVENGCGTCRISEDEFNRLVDLLGGSGDRHQFKTWIAAQRNQELRSNRVFDGAVLKHIRVNEGISLKEAAAKLGISKSYLSRLENGACPVSIERRDEMMRAYGYAPSSFKNLSTDPVRSKAVPSRFKFEILLQNLSAEEADRIFQDVLAKHEESLKK